MLTCYNVLARTYLHRNAVIVCALFQVKCRNINACALVSYGLSIFLGQPNLEKNKKPWLYLLLPVNPTKLAAYVVRGMGRIIFQVRYRLYQLQGCLLWTFINHLTWPLWSNPGVVNRSIAIDRSIAESQLYWILWHFLLVTWLPTGRSRIIKKFSSRTQSKTTPGLIVIPTHKYQSTTKSFLTCRNVGEAVGPGWYILMN